MIPTPSARDLVLSLRTLPSPPTVYQRLTELTARPDWTAEAVSRVIDSDPGVTARTLKLANSPFYGVPREVADIRDAVTLLGVDEVRTLVLATTVLDRFRDIPADIASPEAMRDACVWCAATAMRLAGIGTDPQGSREAFVTGLLFDVGSSVVCLQLPESVREAVAAGRAPVASGPWPSFECAVTGSDQVLVGGELLDRWGLPEPIVGAVRWYPVPEQAAEHRAAAARLHLAVALGRGFARGERQVEAVADPHSAVWRMAGVEPGSLGGLAEQVSEDHGRISSWLFGRG